MITIPAHSFSERVIHHFENHGEKLVLDSATCKLPSYQRHFLRSKEAVAAAFEGCKRTALILGAGSGLDLPLRELAERFEHIILIDMATGPTQKALEKLPDELRDKFTFERADLTGIFGELGQRAEEIAAKQITYSEFVKEILDLLPELKYQQGDYAQTQPSFICSSMVGSQLVGGVLHYLNELSLILMNFPWKNSVKNLKRLPRG